MSLRPLFTRTIEVLAHCHQNLTRAKLMKAKHCFRIVYFQRGPSYQYTGKVASISLDQALSPPTTSFTTAPSTLTLRSASTAIWESLPRRHTTYVSVPAFGRNSLGFATSRPSGISTGLMRGGGNVRKKAKYTLVDVGSWQIPNSVSGRTSRTLTAFPDFSAASKSYEESMSHYELLFSFRNIAPSLVSATHLHLLQGPVVPNLAWALHKIGCSRYPLSLLVFPLGFRKLGTFYSVIEA